MLYNQLNDYLDTNKLVFSGKSGYGELHSTLTSLLFGTNDWHVNIDREKFTANISIHLKRLDTDDHIILIKQLFKDGIQDLELQWFQLYQSNRHQFTKFNGTEAAIGSTSHGVSQGSCLGPLRFLVKYNDVLFALYVKDTSISYSTKSPLIRLTAIEMFRSTAVLNLYL